MKKVFNWLSGRPKDGDVIECIRPFIFFPQLVFCLWLMYKQVQTGALIFGIIALMFAWQMGWGMSLERFKKNDKISK